MPSVCLCVCAQKSWGTFNILLSGKRRYESIQIYVNGICGVVSAVSLKKIKNVNGSYVLKAIFNMEVFITLIQNYALVRDVLKSTLKMKKENETPKSETKSLISR